MFRSTTIKFGSRETSVIAFRKTAQSYALLWKAHQKSARLRSLRLASRGYGLDISVSADLSGRPVMSDNSRHHAGVWREAACRVGRSAYACSDQSRFGPSFLSARASWFSTWRLQP